MIELLIVDALTWALWLAGGVVLLILAVACLVAAIIVQVSPKLRKREERAWDQVRKEVE